MTEFVDNIRAQQRIPRQPRSNVHAQWRGRGRVWIEELCGKTAYVRFDCGDRPRSRLYHVPLALIEFGYIGWNGWRKLNSLAA